MTGGYNYSPLLLVHNSNILLLKKKMQVAILSNRGNTWVTLDKTEWNFARTGDSNEEVYNII